MKGKLRDLPVPLEVSSPKASHELSLISHYPSPSFISALTLVSVVMAFQEGAQSTNIAIIDPHWPWCSVLLVLVGLLRSPWVSLNSSLTLGCREPALIQYSQCMPLAASNGILSLKAQVNFAQKESSRVVHPQTPCTKLHTLLCHYGPLGSCSSHVRPRLPSILIEWGKTCKSDSQTNCSKAYMECWNLALTTCWLVIFMRGLL